MNNWLSEASMISKSLGWALIHSIWQGLFIFICLNIVLRIINNGSARVKYYLSYFSLMSLFLWFINTWITQYQRLQGITVYITVPGSNPQAIKTSYLNPSATTFHTQQYIANILPKMEHYMPAIVSVYIAGFLFMLFRFIVNIIWLRNLRIQGLIRMENEWQQLIKTLQEQLNIVKEVQLFVSERVNVPMVMGVLKPIILLPVATINNMSTDQIEAILLHELGHIKRHDYLLNILQTLVETILFFNPFAWGIASKIRREREHCCDDMVIANSPQPLSYAKALAALETHRLSSSPSIALAATGQKKNQLLHRIKRIMEMRKGSTNYSQLTIVLAIIITFTVCIMWLAPSFAQSSKGSGQTQTTDTKTTGKTRIIIIDDNGNKKEYNSINQIPDNVKEQLTDENNHKKHTSITICNTKKNVTIDSSDLGQTISDIGDEVSKSLSEINWQQISDEMHDAMQQVDSKKLKVQLDEAQKEISNIDWQKLQGDISKGIAEADSTVNDPKLRKELQIEVDEALKQASQATKDAKDRVAELYTQQTDALAKSEAQQKKALAEASAQSGSNKMAKSNLNSYSDMIKKMEDDGLLNQDNGFSIKKLNNTLYINGIEQSSNIYNEYIKYLRDEKIIIKGDRNHLKVDIKD
ncbi:MAG TPA: M56 family metallopeptidase [Flavipsychrobacter sp.]|nr:M56 family metallopeptidase [Flavipsychrobacter sp.]